MSTNICRYPSYMTRELLYELIWRIPRTELSKEFAISDVGLTKKCVKYDIPRPPIGYWAKLAHGKPVKQSKLPEVGHDLALVRFNYSPAVFPTVFEKEQHRVPPDDPRLLAAAESSIPNSLKGGHRMVRVFKSTLLKRPYNRYGFVESPHNGDSSLDIVVTEGALQRACLLLNGLAKLFSTFGWALGHEPPRYSGRRGITHFQIGSEMVQFRIKEKVTQRKREITKEDREHEKRWGYISGPKHEYTIPQVSFRSR